MAALLGAVDATAAPIPVERPPRSAPVDFVTEIHPILQRNCLACHSEGRTKAGLNLESPDRIRTGGDSGPAVVPGKPSESLLLRTAAHEVEDLVMPPAGNKANASDLTPVELGLLALWIEQGAAGEDPRAVAKGVGWRPLPEGWKASFAVALAPDGGFAVVANGNRLRVVHPGSGTVIAPLEDPAVPGAAQPDVVHALAVSPDGSRIAAGGFREVRLWRRRPTSTRVAWPMPAGGGVTVAALDPAGSRVAAAGPGGAEIRRSDDGTPLRRWDLGGRIPALLAFSPDGSRLAVAGGGLGAEVFVLDAGNDPSAAAPVRIEAEAAVSAVAWFDQGRRLAVARAGVSGLRVWEWDGDPAAPREPGRLAGGIEVVAVAGLPGGEGGIVTGSPDGRVRAWSVDPAISSREVDCGGPVDAVWPGGAAGGVLARVGGRGLAWIRFGDTPGVKAWVPGDPEAEAEASDREHAVAWARLERERWSGAVTEAEAAEKKAAEALVAARSRRDGHAADLAAREKELADQRRIETEAAAERDAHAAALQQAEEAEKAAVAASEAARAAVREAAGRGAVAQGAAAEAERLRAELERTVAGLDPGDAGDAAVRTRAALEAARAAAEARVQGVAEARARIEEQIGGLETRAREAGRRQAEADRARTEIPPRRQAAEERRAAAAKAASGLETAVGRARTVLDGSTRDAGLAEDASARAGRDLAAARGALAAAEARIGKTAAGLAAARGRADAARTAGPRAAASGSGLATLVRCDDGGRVVRWDAVTGRAETLFPADPGPVLAASVGNDGVLRVVSGRGLTAAVLREEWELERRIGDGRDPSVLADRVMAVAFSPDGTLLATGGGEPTRGGELRVWRVSDASRVLDLSDRHSDTVMAVAFSPRGDRLASGAADRMARVGPLEAGAAVRTLEGHTHHVLGVAWLADGSVLATSGADGGIKLWNPDTGERRKNIEGLGKEVAAVRAVGLAREFLGVSTAGLARVVRATDGEGVRNLAGVPAYVHAFDLSRDGRIGAGAGDDGVLRVWNLAEGSLIGSFP